MISDEGGRGGGKKWPKSSDIIYGRSPIKIRAEGGCAHEALLRTNSTTLLIVVPKSVIMREISLLISATASSNDLNLLLCNRNAVNHSRNHYVSTCTIIYPM